MSTVEEAREYLLSHYGGTTNIGLAIQELVKEHDFLKRILEVKVSEHVKDVEDLQGVINSQREEISRLKELVYP